ncbi:MAG: HPr-rel-A system PqqD family peptide chaperone [Roseateles sp.]
MMTWTAVRPHELVWREWDGHAAIYDLGSGDTHVINALALEILTLLLPRAWSVQALVHELSDAMPEGLDQDEMARQIEQQLQLLAELGLVRAAQAQP